MAFLSISLYFDKSQTRLTFENRNNNSMYYNNITIVQNKLNQIGHISGIFIVSEISNMPVVLKM